LFVGGRNRLHATASSFDSTAIPFTVLLVIGGRRASEAEFRELELERV
jgi:hypothetical protein